MKHTIFITEEQAYNLINIFNDPLFSDVGHTFSIDTLKTMNWKHGNEIIQYCESCNLICVGEGASRKVFQIDDERVIKIEKKLRWGSSQNTREVDAFRSCNEEMRQFMPNIYDWDKTNPNPLWIISEQVLTATYADFQKILGFDFGSYTSQADITQMQQDLQTYSKYPGKKVGKYSFNLMNFLEAYGDGDISDYQQEISQSKWLQELLKLLDYGIVNYWELENIGNWGLVKRNGEARIIILDIGI